MFQCYCWVLQLRLVKFSSLVVSGMLTVGIFSFRGGYGSLGFVVCRGLNLLASQQICHSSLILLVLVCDSLISMTTYTYGSYGVCPLRLFSRLTRTASPCFSVCLLVVYRLSLYSLHFFLYLESFSLTSLSF